MELYINCNFLPHFCVCVRVCSYINTGNRLFELSNAVLVHMHVYVCVCGRVPRVSADQVIYAKIRQWWCDESSTPNMLSCITILEVR